jgi:hypothetical protein
MVWKEEALERSLVLWQRVEGLVPTQFNHWQDHVDELARMTIHQCPDEEYVKDMHAKIDEIYDRNFEYFVGMPDFGDIMQDVNDYNDEILFKMAEIQFDNDGYAFGGDELSRDDGIMEVQRMLYEFNDYDMFERIDVYVYRYLMTKGFFFLIPDSYYTHERLFANDEVIITVNDCQNILFPEFLHEIQEEVSPYYAGGTPTLMVWGG